MRKPIAIISAFIFIVTLVAAQISAAQERSETERAQERIERQIHHELLTLPYYGVFDHLEYRVDGRAVTLSGHVTRPTLKSDAERAVRDIQDVEEVANNIEVLPPSSADDAIRWAVYRAIYSESGPLFRYGLGSHARVHIIVDSGRVTLVGQVDREADKTFAVLSAKQVPGTFGVEDRITVAG